MQARSLGWEDPRVGNGNPPQYSCLENPMDRGAWSATVQGVAKSWHNLTIEHIHPHMATPPAKCCTEVRLE